MKLSKESKIGLIVVAGIALLFWGINYLKGKDFFSSQKLVYAVYDRVDGLAPSNPVVVNGLKVGSIKTLELLPDHSGKIVVSMHLSSDIRIPRNSIAEIFSADLLGSKSVQLLFGDSPDDIHNGDTLSSGIQRSLTQEVNAQVGPIKVKAENILSSLDSVLAVFRNVFNENTKANLKRSFESIANSLTSIENVTANMDTVLSKEGKMREIFSNISSIVENLKTNNDKITTIIRNFASISDTIAQSRITATLDNTRKTLEQTASLFQKINRGEGTLGQMATNDSLYINLNSTARDLDQLLRDFNANPRRYFGVSLISFGSGKTANQKK
jgi:phospholipid/cholesterol/gamma-HCH transport system substrate-binding protein